MHAETSIIEVPIEQIESGEYQPRLDFDPKLLEELAASIRSMGIVQPVVLRALGPHRFELLAGERRWRAAQLAGRTSVPALVRRGITDEQAAEIALIENLQRENLSAIEEAFAIQRLRSDFQLTQADIGTRIGKTQSTVSHRLRLLSQLHPDVRQLVQGKRLSTGHAKVLMALPLCDQVAMAGSVTQHRLSVRELEQRVRRARRALGAGGGRTDPITDPNTRALERQLSEHLGHPVTLVSEEQGSGYFKISFSDNEMATVIAEKLQALPR